MKEFTLGPTTGEIDPDAEAIGAILAEVIQRRRDGERPRVEEYVAKHPQLETVLREHFQTLELLESEAVAIGFLERPGLAANEPPMLASQLGPAISALSEQLQRVIYLRNFERLRWAEIALKEGQSEEALRREYASAMRDLLDRCSVLGEKPTHEA